MFLQGAAARREELPCLIQGSGADKRPPERRERRPPLFCDYALSSLFFFFFLSWRPPQKHLHAGRVCPCTCVPVHACALGAFCCKGCSGRLLRWQQPRHRLWAEACAPRVHYVPIRHPLSTPRSSGEAARYFWNFCGLPGAQILKEGTKGNSVLIRSVFNLLNGQGLLIVYLPFVLSNIYSLHVVYKEVMVLHIH